MAKKSSSVRGSAARWILIVILVVVVGFAAGSCIPDMARVFRFPA